MVSLQANSTPMKYLIPFLAITLLISSCDDPPIKEKPAAEILQTSVMGDEDKTVANLHIEGVHCDGCRGKIKKELTAMECVAFTEWSESDNPELNRAVVQFDPESCSHEALIDKVNTIVDGQYTVVKAEVVQMSTGS